jgi:REP-associated tyrosine transposase
MKSNFQTRRPSLRLQDYDYTKLGAYFVTICTRNRQHVFGGVEQGIMVLNIIGEIVQEEWLNLPQLRNNIELDQFIVMPNHFHAILFIRHELEGTASRAPTKRIFGKPVSGSLSTIVGGFKSGVAKRINKLRNPPYMGVWQRSFFENVIRTEESLARIREYIATNPLRWELDRENPQRQGEDDFDRWMGQL